MHRSWIRRERELIVAMTAVLALSACGGDKGSASRNDGDAGRSDSGSSTGGQASDGGSSDGGLGGDGGAPASCIDVSELPLLPKEALTPASSCAMPVDCSGTIEGRWAASEACVESSQLFPQLLGVCSTASFSITSSRVTGTVTIEKGHLAQDVAFEVEATAVLPNNCSFCQCEAKEAELIGAGIDADCFPTCTPDCTCLLRTTVTSTGDAPFTMSGSMLSTQDGRSFEACSSDGELSLRETDGHAVVTLIPRIDGPTPERCDGRDNDQDGVVDDDPVECPTCNPNGVCAGAASATCSNGAWQCTYTASTYQATESACDKLDNDCNGVVDEGPLCGPELCDGVDNDANGKIDDAPTDPPPPCSTTGVCSAGGVPVCQGGAWQCDYAHAAWESKESLCDGLDNDCNGQVDEPLKCCVPVQCSDVGAKCGMIDNGCQAMTHCGDCTGNAWCGAVTANQCACVPAVSEPAHDPSAGRNDASVGTIAWNGVTNTFASDWDGDTLYTHGLAYVPALTEGETSNWLVANGFGFALPKAAVVKGITVNIERHASSADYVVDHGVRLVTSSGIGATDRALATAWAATQTAVTYGGSSDTWGGALTPAMINSPDFGVALAVHYAGTAGNSWAYVDHITVAIDYTVSCP